MQWRFWQSPGVEPLSAKVRFILIRERGLSEDGTARLRMLSERGHYSDRPVTRFRVFDPEIAARANVAPRRYRDLSDDLVLYTGHIEREGTIVLNRDRPPQ